MRLAPKRARRPLAMDMTPMIDVVLQLIIFFLFTSGFSRMLRTPIDLPKESGDVAGQAEAPPLIIDVTRDGGYMLAGEPVTLERAVAAVEFEAEHGGEEALDLLIRADRSAPALHINTLAERLAASGIRRWKLGTSEEGGGTP